jgi:3-phosphoshikimate 1-carboxyvinyltransferase
VKETDRITALITEMRKLGFVMESINDCEIRWNGERCEPTTRPIDTYQDHRMALAFAPLCIKFPGLRINDPFVVSKSSPVYWHHLGQAGFNIQMGPGAEEGGE